MRAKIPPSAACRNACSTCPGGIGSSGPWPAAEGSAYGSNSGPKDGSAPASAAAPSLIDLALYTSVGKGLPKRKIRVGSRNVSISGSMLGKGMKSPTFAGAVNQAGPDDGRWYRAGTILTTADRGTSLFTTDGTDLDPAPGKVVDDKIAAPTGGQSAIGSHHRRGDAGEGDVPTEETPRAREKTADVVTGIEQCRLENIVPPGVGTVEPGLHRLDRCVLSPAGRGRRALG